MRRFAKENALLVLTIIYQEREILPIRRNYRIRTEACFEQLNTLVRHRRVILFGHCDRRFPLGPSSRPPVKSNFYYFRRP